MDAFARINRLHLSKKPLAARDLPSFPPAGVQSRGVIPAAYQSALQVFQRIGAVGEDLPRRLAPLQLRAEAACGHAPGQGALPNGAEALAEHRFHPVGAAALAVDVLRENRGMIQFRPQLRCFLPQRLVVMDCRKIRITRPAVQPQNPIMSFMAVLPICSSPSGAPAPVSRCAARPADSSGRQSSPRISSSAASAAATSSSVFHQPGEKRIVPVGKVPSVLWAAGAQ